MEVKLGEILTGGEVRDAVHIAIAPVVAGEYLAPGAHVGVIEGQARTCKEPIGIIDPLLKKPAQKGQRVYVWIYPNTVTGMTHHWKHPAFSELWGFIPKVSQVETWLRNHAQNIGISFETLMDGAKNYIETSKYVFLGDETPDDVWTYNDQFWEYYQEYTGEQVPEEKQTSFFRCAC
jgi:hypothetical protein